MKASRLPNLVIAGVGGAGTTSLFSYLIQHPDICGASVKEVRYFTPIKYGHSLADLASYAHYFSHCADEKYLVESTPGYFYGGEALTSAMREIARPANPGHSPRSDSPPVVFVQLCEGQTPNR